MKIKTDVAITDFSGEPMKLKEGDLTLRHLIHSVAAQALPSDAERSSADKYRVGELAAMASQDEVEYKAEDVVMLKGRIAEMYAPMVVLRAFDLLDPPEKK